MSRPLEKLPDDLRIAGLKAIRETVWAIEKRMKEPGAPVKYPIDWDTPKQKRFVLMSLARKGMLPYRRTNKYRLGWKAKPIPLTGMHLSNAHPAGAIGGMPSGWQSSVTRGRWQYFLKVVFEELAKFPSNLSSHLEVLGKEPE
jgi:hypothetical protein